MFGCALAFEVELDVVQRIAYLLEGCLWVEVRIATGKQLTDVAQTPPLGQLRFPRSAESFSNHLY